jgi:light-regulated signal transduction histidine kinase (bacteriophytochrome)
MVTAYAQLLGERYVGKLDGDADTYIGYAVEGALRMQGMMQGLLAFSRLGRDGLDRTRVDCNTVVEEAVRRLRPTVETSGAVITCGTLPSISADREELLQLFQHLIGNAIKFRGEQVPLIEVRGEEVGAMSEFVVTDNGIGIAMEQIEIIFVIFQRLHPRGQYGGDGLGLAMCRKIVEQHEGRIWVEPKDGAGSAFRFTLPTHSANASLGGL